MKTTPTPYATKVTNPAATKYMRCKGCKTWQTHTVNADAWCCPACGWVTNFSKPDMELIRSRTVEFADHLRRIGYPVLLVEPENKNEPGMVVLIDTNPKQDPTKNRRLLQIQVELNAATYKKEPTVSYTVVAVKYSTKNKKAGSMVYYADDLLQTLGTDLQEQIEIADVAYVYLGLKDLKESVFDLKRLNLASDVEFAKKQLRDAERDLDAYDERKGGRKTK